MHNKLAQKLLSLGVSVSLMAAMVPLGWQSHTAYAEDPTIPQELFVTKDDLVKLCQTKNSGTGLLATGDAAKDKKLRINFGTRPEPVQYYYSITESDKRTANAGPMTWLVAGSDTDNTLVLYSEEPIMSCKNLDSNSNSLFQEDYEDQYWTGAANGAYNSDEEPSITSGGKVNANHYGVSNLRAQMQGLVDKYFTNAEKDVITEVAVKTNDTKNGMVTYTTTDKLYAANGSFIAKVITVGSGDNLIIDKSYWGGVSWLRTPIPNNSDGSHYILPSRYVSSGGVTHVSSAVSSAFNLSLSSVEFLYAASVACTTSFAKIADDSPLTIRLGGSAMLSNANVTFSGTKLTYTAPQKSRLIVLASDGNGTYQYAKIIDAAVANATLDLNTVATDLAGTTITAKAWIEKDGEGQLIYATKPVDFNWQTHPDWGTLSSIAGIAYWVDTKGTTSVVVTENDKIWLKEESGGTSAWYGVDNSAGVFEIGSRFWVRWLKHDSDPVEFASLWEQLDDEHKNSIDGDNAYLFEIGVTSPDGANYTNLSQKVPVYVQIGDDWDKKNLQGYYVSVAQDEQVQTTFVDDFDYPEGQATFGIMYLNHFSPYFIYDKLPEEEKAAQNQVKTSDQVSLFTISVLGLTITLALGLMLSTNSNKRKFDE